MWDCILCFRLSLSVCYSTFLSAELKLDILCVDIKVAVRSCFNGICCLIELDGKKARIGLGYGTLHNCIPVSPHVLCYLHVISYVATNIADNSSHIACLLHFMLLLRKTAPLFPYDFLPKTTRVCDKNLTALLYHVVNCLSRKFRDC